MLFFFFGGGGCFVFLVVVCCCWLKQQKFIFSQFWRLVVQDQGAGRVGFSWDLSPCLTSGCLVAVISHGLSFMHVHSSCLCFFLLVLEGLLGRWGALSWDMKAGGEHTWEYSLEGWHLVWAPMLFLNCDIDTHPSRVGVSVPSPWNWANLCNCLHQKNVLKLTLCDFRAWVLGGNSTLVWYCLALTELLCKKFSYLEAAMWEILVASSQKDQGESCPRNSICSSLLEASQYRHQTHECRRLLLTPTPVTI